MDYSKNPILPGKHCYLRGQTICTIGINGCSEAVVAQAAYATNLDIHKFEKGPSSIAGVDDYWPFQFGSELSAMKSWRVSIKAQNDEFGYKQKGLY
ncbi:hypothetical protein [Microbulbifer sp. JTAC008]|uniref:hypothetical protein n=1 Tax=Microbulbifer sp. JTAC008 TaxID=3243374 RepID=UPI00403A1B2B